MKHLPYDISRCCNDECPIRLHCMRWTDLPKEGNVPFTLFNPTNSGPCEGHIPTEPTTT